MDVKFHRCRTMDETGVVTRNIHFGGTDMRVKPPKHEPKKAKISLKSWPGRLPQKKRRTRKKKVQERFGFVNAISLIEKWLR